MKFQAVHNKTLIGELLPKLHELGYKKVHNHTTGGDDDFIIIDCNAKRYAFFENGFGPSISCLFLYENKILKDLFGMRWNEMDDENEDF